MASDEKWYFTKEQLENTPSRQCGIDWFKELFYRQQAAYFIQDMGQRLRVSQLCINTATVYMHRFYVFHSFSHFPWYSIAAAALFLAAKVEEQPRKLEHVIRVHNLCKNPREISFDVNSERYLQQSQDLVFNENILLQTLGFDVAIDHPHAHVVRCCHLVRASKDLAQTSYFMASTSLHLTTMCLQYKPTVVACFCIHLACKWSNWEIPLSTEKKEWYSYVDPTVTDELLQQLTEEFLKIYERCPARIKDKIMAIGEGASISRSTSHVSSPFDSEPRKLHPPTDMRDPHHRLHHHEKAGAEDLHKHRSSRPLHESSSSSSQQRENDYRDKKERDRMVQHSSSKPPMGAPLSSSGKPNVPHGHHRPVDPKMKPPTRPPSVGHLTSSSRTEHRDILREAVCDIGIRDPHRETVRVSDFNDSKELYSRSDKEIDKRAYSHSASESNSLNNSIDHGLISGDKRPETSRSRLAPDPKLMQHKHESSRRHEDLKQQNDIKKHLNTHYDNKNVYEKSNSHLKQGMISTSQKTKSPYPPEASKSVPNKAIKKESIEDLIKIESHNGHSSNGSYSLPSFNDNVEMLNVKIKEEPLIPPTITKKPSMFSPEKTPPRKQPSMNKRAFEAISHQDIPTTVSNMESSESRRSRTLSNSSEPELRPVMKKIDQVEGFENILRDSTIGIKSEVPDKYSEIKEAMRQQMRENDSNSNGVINSNGVLSGSVPLSQPIAVNGLETNPTAISNLLKQAPSVPHLPTITKNVPDELLLVTKEKEHHKDKKKKNKEKHKHKDKDKSREEKEKKKKHKEKDRDKHKSKNKDKDKQDESSAQPIILTISKDKIQPPEPIAIKIKIPKDRIKTDVIGEASTHNPGIKIKISKDVINNISSESKKRDREKSTLSDGPPLKVSKSNYTRQHGEKQNGRNSFGKVAHMGDGDTSIHRMAESKYSKGAST